LTQGHPLLAYRGDITESRAEAVINAANSQLLRGGGVDGAIHRAAGPELQLALSSIYPGGCPTGQAVTTPAYGLPARLLVHAVGPRWEGGEGGESALLASAYRAAFALAAAAGCQSAAAPALSTGVYGFPLELAAPIAVAAARAALGTGPGQLLEIEFVLFDDRALEAFRRHL
jgi:O-acetyl-ADP-ribose deacetylase (regulator of RNase III)